MDVVFKRLPRGGRIGRYYYPIIFEFTCPVCGRVQREGEPGGAILTSTRCEGCDTKFSRSGFERLRVERPHA
jgi:hypothetical protein